MQVQFGVAADKTATFVASLALCREFGANLTISSNRSIQITEGDAIANLARYLSKKVEESKKRGDYVCLSFDNFLVASQAERDRTLEKGVWGRNGQMVFSSVWDYMFAGSNSHVRSILCPVTKSNYEKWYTDLRSKTYQILAKHTNCLTNPHKATAYVSNKWAFCLIPLQAAVTDQGILDLIPRLFEMPAPDVEQRVPLDAQYSYFTTPKWYQTYMYPVFEALVRMVNSDLAIEDKLIKLMRSKDIQLSNEERKLYLEGSSTRAAFDFRDWDKITRFTKGTGKGLELFDYRLRNLLDSTGDLYDNKDNTSELMNRIKVLVVAGVLKDMMKTILKFGPNPKLRFDYESERKEAKENLVKQYLE